MSRWEIGRGAVRLEVDDGIRDAMEAAIREAAPRTVEAIERELKRIVREAEAAWPVGREREGRERGRPHSRDLFRVVLTITPDLAVEGTIYNDAPYAYKIKSDGASPWQEHVVGAVREAEGRIAEILAEEIAAAISS